MSYCLKKYITFPLCVALLNVALLSPLALIAESSTPSSSEEKMQLDENAEQVEQEQKKPTIKESWDKVITLRWKELNKSDVVNISAPIAGVITLGLSCYYYSKTVILHSTTYNHRNHSGPDTKISPVITTDNQNSAPILSDLGLSRKNDLNNNAVNSAFNASGPVLSNKDDLAKNLVDSNSAIEDLDISFPYDDKNTTKNIDHNKEKIDCNMEQSVLKNNDKQVVNTVLDTLMKYAENSGQWFVDFFDTNKKISYNKHVDEFGNIIKIMKEDSHAIDASVDKKSIAQASKDFMLFLIRQLESTYKIFLGYKNYSSWWAPRLGMDLGGQQIKEKRNRELRKLYTQFHDFPDLSAKVNQLQKTMNDYGDLVENKGTSGLLAGMVYRLDCQ